MGWKYQRETLFLLVCLTGPESSQDGPTGPPRWFNSRIHALGIETCLGAMDRKSSCVLYLLPDTGPAKISTASTKDEAPQWRIASEAESTSVLRRLRALLQAEVTLIDKKRIVRNRSVVLDRPRVRVSLYRGMGVMMIESDAVHDPEQCSKSVVSPECLYYALASP